MSGYHLSRPRNGSGKVSPFYRVNFTVAGEPYRLATGERDHGRADLAAARFYIEAHERARVPVPKEALTQLQQRSLAELGAMLVVKVEDQLARRTIVRNPAYVANLKADLKHVVARFKSIDEITTSSWKAAADSLHEGYPEAEGSVSWRYLQRVTITARALLRFANGLGLLTVVPELPAPSGEDVALEQEPGAPMTEKNRDKFLRALGQLGKTRPGAARAQRVYTALFWSALRRSALERLVLRQIDWEAQRIQLPARKAKKKKESWIAMHPKVAQAIKAELRERPNISPDEPIFGKFDLRQWFTEAAALVGIDTTDVKPHHFTRTTTATLAGNKGASLTQLMALGTWETPAMAMRYVKIDAQRSKEALDLLDAPAPKRGRKRRVQTVRKTGA